MKIASLKRVICICLTLCMVLGVISVMPAFASTVQVTITNNAAGFYTDSEGVKTGALGFNVKVDLPKDASVDGYGIKYLPRAIYDDTSIAEKPWLNAAAGKPAMSENGSSFFAELQEIPEELFKEEFAVIAYTIVNGVTYTSAPAYAKVQGSSDLGTKQRLQADLNGNFTVLCVADPQSENWNSWALARTDLENAILRSNPDFVMIQGDLNDYNFTMPEAYWDYFIEPLEERDIPWAVINGNHDSYSSVNHVFYTSYKNCLTEKMDSKDPLYYDGRPVNYVLPVYSNDGEENVFAVWGMDSGTAGSNGYHGVTAQQLQWYERESDKLTAANGGTPVPGLMCVHIPITETFDMYYDNYAGTYVPKQVGDVHLPIYGVLYNSVDNGYAANENRPRFTTAHGATTTSNSSGLDSITSEANNVGFYDAMKANGDIKITTFGHNHTINIIGSYNGMLLGFTGKIGKYDNLDYLTRGGRVIRFNQENSSDIEVSFVSVLETTEDQPTIDTEAQIVENPIPATVKAKNFAPFLNKKVQITMGGADDITVTATVDALKLNTVKFAFDGIPNALKNGNKTPLYNVLAYTGNSDVTAATPIYVERSVTKPSEMNIDVGNLVDGELFVKFAAEGQDVFVANAIYRFALIALNSEGKVLNLKPYNVDGSALASSATASYMIYGGRQINTDEAIAEGLDVSKAADDSGEFMLREFRSIVTLN